MGSLELGRRVREARTARELSYRDLRQASGLALGHLQRLERGEHRPQPETLRRLAQALEVPYEELLRLAGYL